MSEVFTGLPKVTFGLISNKLRTYGAEKFQDGGLTDQMFRDLIVRELDDIKSKLDAISRKDLCTSISSLRQGIQRLNDTVGESSESGNPSAAKLPESQDKTSIGASSPATKFVGNVLAIATGTAPRKVKIDSRNELVALARESFRDAGKEAQYAFNNAALTTEERILASKVRIASGILQHKNPTVAANDCLLYLQELHDMPDIKEIFSVYIQGGIKSFFKKDSRTEIVETVTMINLMLADFISKFTERRMAVFDWPMIKCGKRVVHPIHYKKESMPTITEMKITPPWDIVEFEGQLINKNWSLTTKGDLICFTDDRRGLQKLDKTTGKLQPYCLSPLEDNTEHPQPSGEFIGIAIDENDTVYVLSRDGKDGYTLSVYSPDGRNTHHCSLEFLQRLSGFQRITVTNNKNIVICFQNEGKITVHLCDCKGKLINSSSELAHPNDDGIKSVSVSCDNEIIFITAQWTDSKETNVLYIYSADGQPKFRPSEFHPGEGNDSYDRLFYNQDTNNIIGHARDYDDDKILIEYLSGQTAKLQLSYVLYNTNFPESIFNFCLVHHINGALAFADKKYVIVLRKPSP